MPASSLIFVVIIAVWAAFLLQHWIRRRDHIATAKSVDRFSEAMRVLERRQVLARMDLTRPAPRSYAVSPLRPAHPDVVVKRAEAGAAPRGPGAAVETGRPPRRRTGRALRAVTLLLAVAVTAAAVALGAGPLLPWWVAAASPAMLVLTVAVLRVTAPRPAGRGAARAAPGATAQAPRHGAAASRPAQRRPGAPGGSSRGGSAPAAPRPRRVVREAEPGESARTPGGPHPSRDPQVPPHARPAAERRTTVAVAAVAGPQPYDVERVEQAVAARDGGGQTLAASGATTAGPSSSRPAEPAPPGSWQPVPVPPPTYLMKAPARRPVHATARHTPVDELPFDGHALALEEEFEELPAVHG